jgi:hypothetical protein
LLLARCYLVHQCFSRFTIRLVINRSAGVRRCKAAERYWERNRSAGSVDSDYHQTAICFQITHKFRRSFHLGGTTGGKAHRISQFDRLELGFVDLLSLLGQVPLGLRVEVGAHAWLHHHSERHHHHKVLLVLAFDLPQGRRHQNRAGVAIELVTRQANAEILRLFFAALILRNGGRLLHGVELAVSDDHDGLKKAIAEGL